MFESRCRFYSSIFTESSPQVLCWVICKDKSSLPEAFLVKGVLKICMGSENMIRHECSPVNLLHIFRTAFTKNASGRLLCNFIEITLRHGCSLVNLMHIFRTPFTGDLLILKPAISFGKNPGNSKHLEILI